MEPNLVDVLIDGMYAALDAEYGQQVDEFLDRHNATKWIITSDYSMGKPEFTHDSMAFVLIPYIPEMFPPTEIEKNLPCDFKDCGNPIDESYISYLRKASTFSQAWQSTKCSQSTRVLIAANNSEKTATNNSAKSATNNSATYTRLKRKL